MIAKKKKGKEKKKDSPVILIWRKLIKFALLIQNTSESVYKRYRNF